MNLKLPSGAIFCAALALMAIKAEAQTETDNDLILCFRATQGTGSTTNLYVNLGNFAGPVTSLNLETDLTNTYGASWNTDQYLFWSVMGTTGGAAEPGYPADTVFVTAPDPANDPSDPGTTSAQVNDREFIEGFYGEYNNGTTGHLSNVKTNSAVDPTSYTSQYSNASGANGFDQPFEQLGDVGNGSDSSDLWELYPGSIANQQQIDLNTFTLSSNGMFTAAVPEPSTWAMLIAGAASLFFFRRRARA